MPSSHNYHIPTFLKRRHNPLQQDHPSKTDLNHTTTPPTKRRAASLALSLLSADIRPQPSFAKNKIKIALILEYNWYYYIQYLWSVVPQNPNQTSAWTALSLPVAVTDSLSHLHLHRPAPETPKSFSPFPSLPLSSSPTPTSYPGGALAMIHLPSQLP